jgi:glutamine amidotransferase
VIAVLDYGIGNLRSAQKALERLGAAAELVTEPEQARGATGVVLPGVGAFGACMDALRDSGLDKVAIDAIDAGTPFLAICVGMQMLYEGSDENPDASGLGVLPGRVVRLPDGVKHPQMQWNALQLIERDHPMFAGLSAHPWVYFVHSYAPGRAANGVDGSGDEADDGDQGDDVIATCDYGGEVVAAVGRGPLWATQFHPEKSSATGLALLANFVRACDA